MVPNEITFPLFNSSVAHQFISCAVGMIAPLVNTTHNRRRRESNVKLQKYQLLLANATKRASATELDALAANTCISMNADDDRECGGCSLWMEPCAFDPNDIFNIVNHLNVIRDSMNYILR